MEFGPLQTAVVLTLQFTERWQEQRVIATSARQVREPGVPDSQGVGADGQAVSDRERSPFASRPRATLVLCALIRKRTMTEL